MRQQAAADGDRRSWRDLQALPACLKASSTKLARLPGIPGVLQGLEYRGGTTSGIPGMPQGLEYLTQVDQVLVHQQVEIFEGWSTLPSYVN